MYLKYRAQDLRLGPECWSMLQEGDICLLADPETLHESFSSLTGTLQFPYRNPSERAFFSPSQSLLQLCCVPIRGTLTKCLTSHMLN